MDSKNKGESILISLIKVIITTISAAFLSYGLKQIGVGKDKTIMVFLVGVLIVTTVTNGYLYGAIAAVISVFLFNYYFTEPIRSFDISDSQDLVLIFLFLIASIITSTITSKLQFQTLAAKRNERTSKILYDISKSFLNVMGRDNIIHKGIKHIKEYAGYDSYVKLDTSDKIFSSPDIVDYTEVDEDNIYILPIKGLSNQIGTLRIVAPEESITEENKMLIKTIVYQVALALDREYVYYEREKIKVSMENEHLKGTLLRSISHDLRTPLTGIKGASELIVEGYDRLEPSEVIKLAMDINEEAVWLINTVQNILDMTRISEGKLTVNKEYEAVDDIINQALNHLKQLRESGRLQVSYPDEIVILHVDVRLIIQVLVNLLDNAYKHSDNDSPIYLNAFSEKGNIVIEVTDEGEGIDPDILDKIFEGFVTKSKRVADSSFGVGLGLSICKAIVKAHNGNITVENRIPRGAKFRVELPVEVED